MRILALGDVVGVAAAEYLHEKLWRFRTAEKIDLVIANGENTSDIHGLSHADAETLLGAGVDLITLGNHAFGRKDLHGLLEEGTRVIRPANFPPEAPGVGETILNADGFRVLCVNAVGTVFLPEAESPFAAVSRILAREAGAYDFALLDFHAEATSEKQAIARYFDGRIAVIYGTHTHVQTADERILPGGTGYLTDLGMCGSSDGILGTETGSVLQKFLTGESVRFTAATGNISAEGAIFEVDPFSAKTVSVRRVRF